jgi:ATP-dependent exoDNAse (exonuclease V) alpha subunit
VVGIAKEQGARILLTGDIKQHNAVERGDALRIIQKYGGVEPARINEIQRQKITGYKNAVELISNGKMEEGVNALDKMGAIKESDNFQELKEKVATEYVGALKAKENTLIVATTHAQGVSVTQTIREKMRSENMLSKEEKVFHTLKNLNYTEAQKKDSTNYREGMSVQFHQNISGGISRGAKYDVLGRDKEGNIRLGETGGAVEKKNSLVLPIDAPKKFSVYEKQETNLAKGDRIRITQNGFSTDKQRVNNGNFLTVKGFDGGGNIVATSGKRDLVLEKGFGNLTHGYYTTSPASQGKSVNRVIVMQSSLSGKAASKEQFYVSASRGKFAISVHTDDKENLMQSVKRSTQRMTATEVANNDNRSKVVDIKDRLKKVGSIYQAVKSKVANWKKTEHKEDSVLKLAPKPLKQTPNVAPSKGR